MSLLLSYNFVLTFEKKIKKSAQGKERSMYHMWQILTFVATESMFKQYTFLVNRILCYTSTMVIFNEELSFNVLV